MNYIKVISNKINVPVNTIFNLALTDKRLFTLLLNFDGVNGSKEIRIINRINKLLTTKEIK